MTPSAKAAALMLTFGGAFFSVAAAIGLAGAFLAFVMAGVVWVVWRLLGREIMEGRR